MKWFNQLIVWILPIFPKSFIWLFSQRYVAGKSLSAAIDKTKALNAIGCCATIDVLGEDIETLDEATNIRNESLRVLDEIHENKLDANLSIKLTSLGLHLDKEVCYQNVIQIAKKAGSLNNFVRIDMEDSTCTDDTLEIYHRIRKKYKNVGTVIQAYLKRSHDDVSWLIKNKIAQLRICKGIYNESPEIAIKNKEEIRKNFLALITIMMQIKSYIGIATHDTVIIKRALEKIETLQVNREDYEFQMLLGVTEKLRGEITKSGHRLRVYVPYGEHWYGYSTRRLKENPQIAGHIIKNLFIRR